MRNEELILKLCIIYLCVSVFYNALNYSTLSGNCGRESST